MGLEILKGRSDRDNEVGDAGTRLLFKFTSETHGLNDLSRHRGREGRSQCDDECESIAHVLWDCPA